jgi:hypothetical protein
MSPKEQARERRAAERARRRSNCETAASPNGGASNVSRDAMRLVAAAAARGAAQALAERRRRELDTDDAPEEIFDAEDAFDPGELPAPVPASDTGEPRRAAEPEPEPEPEPVSPSGLQSIVRTAREVLRELHGVDAETVSSVARSAGGWTVGLEVVELRRVPDSMDVLATYEVEVDGDGNVLRYERVRRYKRAQSERGGDG